MLENAGFDDVIAEDQTNLVCNTMNCFFFNFTVYLFSLCCSNKYFLFQFLKTLEIELNGLENNKVDFIDDFSEVNLL